MALSADSVFEVRTAGNDTNGGGFVTGASGTDYSLQDNKNTAGSDISTTDAVANGTTTLTSATADFTTAIIGNIIYLQGGTGSLAATRYQVTARASSTSITLDRAVAAGTGITMNIGGAFASLGILGSTAVALIDGHRIFIKAGTYTVTTASTNVSNGCFNKSQYLYIEGYQTTRGDLGTPPLITADGVITSFILISLSGAACFIKNVNVSGNNRSVSRGILLAANGVLYKCKGINCTNGAFVGFGTTYAIFCSATGCANVAAFTGMHTFGCIAFSNTFTGFSHSTAVGIASHCISYNNSGATSDGFAFVGTTGQYLNCVAYNNGRHGFYMGGSNVTIINCIAEDNVNTGFINGGGSRLALQFINCGAYSNNVADFAIGTSLSNVNQGPIIGTGSFFTNAAGGDFSLNNTAGNGAALRAAGFPVLFPEGLTANYLDIGAAQHQDAGGGGGGGGEHSSVF